MSPRSMLSEPPTRPPTLMGAAPDVGSVIVVCRVVVVLWHWPSMRLCSFSFGGGGGVNESQ